MKKVGIGLVGVGTISGIYLENLHGMFSDSVEVVAYADRIQERADNAAEKWGGRACKSNEALYGMEEVEIVLNLTTPDSHTEVNLGALEAGKCAYVEKPLAITREDGRRQRELAVSRGLLLGGAPDTWLGGGIQTCRKLIDDGWIGTPVAATAFMTGHGPESWHPAPEFYYKQGAGPLFDMGPYYITALLSLLGPVRDVAGSARISEPTRRITSQPLRGAIIDVEVPTHVTGILNFACGAVGTLVMSFDIWGAELPRIEIYGTEGSLSVPDPNFFNGPVRLRKPGAAAFAEVPLAFGNTENCRALGVVDMACALRRNRKPRNDSAMTYHVLDVMQGILDASEGRKNYTLESTCERPAPLALGMLDGEIND